MSKRLCISFLVAAVLALVCGAAQAEPRQWTGNGHFYEVVTAPILTWPEAESAAEQSTLDCARCRSISPASR